MEVKNMWSQKEIEDLRIIFQDIEDLGYTCYFRQIGQIIIWKKANNQYGEIIYNEEFYDRLSEAVDRLEDIYDIDRIAYQVEIANMSRDRFFKRKCIEFDSVQLPEKINLVWKPNKFGGISGTLENEMDRMQADAGPDQTPSKAITKIEVRASPKKIISKIKSFWNFVD